MSATSRAVSVHWEATENFDGGPVISNLGTGNTHAVIDVVENDRKKQLELGSTFRRIPIGCGQWTGRC